MKHGRLESGYEVFTPPESAYDSIKVRNKLWGKAGPRPLKQKTHPMSQWRRNAPLGDSPRTRGWKKS